jgi:glutaredoxin
MLSLRRKQTNRTGSERRETDMKEIELIFLPGCPYCVKAKQAVTELQAESESYAGLPLKWINEQEETGYADTHDYYYVPTVYWNDRKFFEAAPGDSLEKIKAGIRTAFDAAVESAGR